MCAHVGGMDGISGLNISLLQALEDLSLGISWTDH
jgi:hypothetical protein